MMDFYISNSSRSEIGVMPDLCSIDLEIGKGTKNDFKIVIPYRFYDPNLHKNGFYFYHAGTEYGGFIEMFGESTAAKEIYLSGKTFRGILEDDVIIPPTNATNHVLNGTLNECMEFLVGGRFGGLFYINGGEDIKVSNHKVGRFDTILEALESLLAKNSMHLRISAKVENGRLSIELSPQQDEDLSEGVEVSQDYKLHFKMSQLGRPYNYMVCAGGGTGTDRVVVILKRNKANSYSEVDAIQNSINSKVYFYDYSSAETREVLIEEAEKKFEEINKTDAQEVTVKDTFLDHEIGCYVAGYSTATGKKIREQISQKVIRVENNKIDIKYKAGK